MGLGEVQKQHATIAGQAAEIGSLKSTVANQNGVIAALAERLEKPEAEVAARR